MVNQGLYQAFMAMPVEELKEFVEASEQISFAEDSKVRLLLNEHTQLETNRYCNISTALSEMYVALAHALYEKLEPMKLTQEMVKQYYHN